MFEFSKLQVRIKSVKTSTKKDKKAPADRLLGVTLECSLSSTNELLDRIDPGLCAKLYQQDPEKSDLLESLSERQPWARKLGTVPMRWYGMGYTMKIQSELAFVKQHVIKDVKVNKISLDLKDDGTVAYSFNLFLRTEDDEEAGKLCHLQKSDVSLSLVPPKVPQEGIEGEADDEDSDGTEEMFGEEMEEVGEIVDADPLGVGDIDEQETATVTLDPPTTAADGKVVRLGGTPKKGGRKS